jgi:hypothetical protein
MISRQASALALPFEKGRMGFTALTRPHHFARPAKYGGIDALASWTDRCYVNPHSEKANIRHPVWLNPVSK